MAVSGFCRERSGSGKGWAIGNRSKKASGIGGKKMFDRLEDLVRRLEEINMELTDPDTVSNQEKYRQLMKEQKELAPIVDKYMEYKKAKEGVEDSLALLEEESDEEMREMAKEELGECREAVERCEQELKILMLPKDPNDEKNVIVEIRGGAGGDEAALFAADLFRMYSLEGGGDERQREWNWRIQGNRVYGDWQWGIF